MKKHCEYLVSFIIPIYNAEKYLDECIKSIIKQTYSNFELLLVNDGSTDNSAIICDTYANKDSRIKVIHKINGGDSSARNIGLDNAKGEYICFVDADDVIHPKLLETTLSVLMETQQDIIIYRYKLFNNKIIYSQNSNNSFFVMSNQEAIKEMLKGQKYRGLMCNKLVHRHYYENIRFPEGRSFGEDTYVTYQVLIECPSVVYLDEIFYYYRQNDKSALHQDVSEKNLEVFDTYNTMQENLLKHYSNLEKFFVKAYIDRLFDFFLRIKNKNYSDGLILLRLLKKKIKISIFQILQGESTLVQKILLLTFYVSPKLFLLIYRKI